MIYCALLYVHGCVVWHTLHIHELRVRVILHSRMRVYVRKYIMQKQHEKNLREYASYSSCVHAKYDKIYSSNMDTKKIYSSILDNISLWCYQNIGTTFKLSFLLTLFQYMQNILSQYKGVGPRKALRYIVNDINNKTCPNGFTMWNTIYNIAVTFLQDFSV